MEQLLINSPFKNDKWPVEILHGYRLEYLEISLLLAITIQINIINFRKNVKKHFSFNYHFY